MASVADFGTASATRRAGLDPSIAASQRRGTSGFDIFDVGGTPTSLPDDARFQHAAYPMSSRASVLQSALVGLVAMGTIGTASSAVWLKPPTMRTQGEGLDYSSYSVEDYGHVGMLVKLGNLHRRIEMFSRRDINWDGDDGIPPIGSTVREALRFLDNIKSELSLPHEVYAPGDGEIAFQWRGRDGESFIEVAFEGNSSISWYAKVGKAAPQNDEQPFRIGSISLDARLVTAISSIA